MRNTWMAGTSPAMTESVSPDVPPYRYIHRTDRNPDVVAARGDDGRDRQDPGLPACCDDLCDRRAGSVCELPVPSFRFRGAEAAACRLGRRGWRPVRLS